MKTKSTAIALAITLGLAAGAAHAAPTTKISPNGHTVQFADGKMAKGSFSYFTTFTENFNGAITGFSLNDTGMNSIGYSLYDITDSKTIASGTGTGSFNISEVFTKGAQFQLTVSGNAKNNGSYIGTISAVPEPSEYVLIGSGLALMGFVANRRSRQI